MLNTIIVSAVSGLALAVLAWIPTRLKKPTDLERAVLLEKLAAAAAATVVAMFPGAKWADLVKAVAQQLSSAAGLPTANADAIQRATVKALTDLGRGPDVAGK